MSYTVTWTPAAERRLTELWLENPARRAIADAANAIDTALATNPNRIGESRVLGTRILFVPPLGVLYSTNEQDRTVRVLTVWRFETHGDTE